MILNNEKKIEIRGKRTNNRGTIGIIKSGTKKIFGTVELIHCEELTKRTFDLWKNEHKLDISYDELLNIYSKPYAWFLCEAKRYDSPINYNHKQGCITWVNIEKVKKE